MKRSWRTIVTTALALAMCLTVSVSSLAQSPQTIEGNPDADMSVQLTVYNQNLGLVKDVRTLALEEGENVVRFTDVASSINPTSVQVISLDDPTGTRVLEQNYEYDIVSSRKLLEKYVDLEITLTTTEGSTYTGTLLSGADDIILATEEGIKLVKLSQVQEFAFPELPEGLITKPSLVWLLNSSETGEQRIRVTYLTSGIDWRSDYVAMLSGDDESLSLTGWVTVDNQSGATYTDAKLKLVAGDINRVYDEKHVYEDVVREMAAPTPAPSVAEREFFEYHIYEVERPVTVKDQQTKQIEFVTAPEVSVDKVFVFESAPMPYRPYRGILSDSGYGTSTAGKVQVFLEFDNSEESGLGIPLPEGIVRVYKEDIDGGAEFVGEDSIDHTPRDEQITLLLGEAFDIVGEREQVRFRQLGNRSIEETIRITLRNHKEEDVSVRAIEYLFRAGDAEIIESNLDYQMLDANTARFDVEVPADGQAQFSYTVVYRW